MDRSKETRECMGRLILDMGAFDCLIDRDLLYYPIYCNIIYILFTVRFTKRCIFLPPEIADLCNINSNRKWMDISLNGYRKDFKSLWGPNGTWDQEMVILINDKHIAVSEIQSGVKKCTSG